MNSLIYQIGLLFLIIGVMIFIAIKEIKRRRIEIMEKNKGTFSKKEKKAIKKDIQAEKNKESLTVFQNNDGVSKLLLKLEEMSDREDEVIAKEINQENLNFFSTVINNDPSFIQSAKNTIELDEEDMKSISTQLNLKLGSEISSMVRRVDFDGNIVLGMEALKFITGDHIPLITPGGSIRVVNLISLEEDLIMSIEAGKPMFIIDKKDKSVRRIEKEELETLIRYSDELEIKNIISNNEKEIKELILRNKHLELLSEELKNQIIKLETKNEIYENMSFANMNLFQNKEKEKTEIKKPFLENITESEAENTPEKILEINKREIESITQNKDSRATKENTLTTPNENKENQQSQEEIKNKDLQEKLKAEQAKDEKETQEDRLKTLTKKASEEFLEEFFLKNLLGKNGGNNKDIEVENLNFINYDYESFSKTYNLKYLYGNTINLLGEFLAARGYANNKENINKILENQKVTIVENAYFTKAINKQMYKSKIIQIKFKQDQIASYALIDEKRNGFKGGFTKEDYERLIIKTLDKSFQSTCQRALNLIENNNFKTLKD